MVGCNLPIRELWALGTMGPMLLNPWFHMVWLLPEMASHDFFLQIGFSCVQIKELFAPDVANFDVRKSADVLDGVLNSRSLG